jgi:hypothetical protein
MVDIATVFKQNSKFEFCRMRPRITSREQRTVLENLDAKTKPMHVNSLTDLLVWCLHDVLSNVPYECVPTFQVDNQADRQDSSKLLVERIRRGAWWTLYGQLEEGTTSKGIGWIGCARSRQV